MDRVKALFSWLKNLALRGFAIFQANKMSVYSGYATLFIVTAIFPCIILIISIVNLLPGYSTKDVADIFFQILPDLGPIREFVESMMTNLKSQSGGLLASAAAVTTLWSASKGVSAVQKGLNQLDEAPVMTPAPDAALDNDSDVALGEALGEEPDAESGEDSDAALTAALDKGLVADLGDDLGEEPGEAADEDPDEDPSEDADAEDKAAKKEKAAGLIGKGMVLAKGILKRLLFTLMIIILIPALLVFEMLGDSIAGLICSSIEKLNIEGLNSLMPYVDSIFNVTALVVIAFALLVILEIFARLPDKRRTLKSQLPGAILTGVCWLAFTELFSFFIPRFYHASSLYGSLASLFLLLLWLRFVVMILFGGGVLNRTLEEQKLDRETDDAGGEAD